MTLLDLFVHAEFDVVSFLSLCSEWGCVVVRLSLQPPPTGPGVVGPSLPGGAPVPRFTPLLLQWREQAERVLMKFSSAIIVHSPVLFYLVGGWVVFLSLKPPEALSSLFLFPHSFTLWALLFVIARLLTLTLSVLTFSFGLPRTENQGFSLAEGNFNVLTVRQVQATISRTVF